MTAAWAIRAGAHPHEAGGHVTRCILLAQALAADAAVTLVLDSDAPVALRARAASVAPVTTPAEALLQPWEGAVLDGYVFPLAEWQSWRQRADVVACLCDSAMAETPLAAGAIELVVAPWATARRPGEHVLAGIENALVDPRFAALPGRMTSEVVCRVLVTFGMRDSKNMTGLALRALAMLRDRGFAPSVDVTLGPTAPHAAEVHACLKVFGQDAELHVDSEAMDRLLNRADLVVGGGGVSLLERLAAGVPSLTVPLSPGQAPAVAAASAAGATSATERPETLTVAALADDVAMLANDRRRRAAMAAAGRSLVDGRAAERVAAVLLALAKQAQRRTAGMA